MNWGLHIDMHKRGFFDRDEVLAKMGKAKRNVASRFGAFVRTRARSSLRRRKKPSAPGQPPSVHSTDSIATLKAIFFSYDATRQAVVIGPHRLNQMHVYEGKPTAGTVPATHEHGGRIGIREKKVGKHWRSVGRRKPRPGQPTRIRMATYPARPFMQPAFKTELDKLPPLWRNAVK